MSIELVMPSNHLILCHPLLHLSFIFSSIRVFSAASQLFTSGGQSIGASASASVLLVNIQSWFPLGLTNLLAVWGTFKSLLQHCYSKALNWCSAFFMVQLSHPYVTIGNTIALSIWTFVSKVMSLLFNMLSRIVIAVLPRSKPLLISWLQSRSAVTLEPKKIKFVTSWSSICHKVMGPDTMILTF